jgi:hypothetical protein
MVERWTWTGGKVGIIWGIIVGNIGYVVLLISDGLMRFDASQLISFVLSCSFGGLISGAFLGGVAALLVDTMRPLFLAFFSSAVRFEEEFGEAGNASSQSQQQEERN